MNTTYGLHRAVLLNRNGVAMMFENRRRTWIELADRVARLAGALKALGVGRGDRVEVLSLNQDRYVELYLGVAWAGAVIVPLNIRWSAPENEDALRDSRPKVLVVDAAFSGAGAALAQKTGSIRLVYADDAPAAPPDEAASYEGILAAASPVPGHDLGRGRPRNANAEIDEGGGADRDQHVRTQACRSLAILAFGADQCAECESRGEAYGAVD